MQKYITLFDKLKCVTINIYIKYIYSYIFNVMKNKNNINNIVRRSTNSNELLLKNDKILKNG